MSIESVLEEDFQLQKKNEVEKLQILNKRKSREEDFGNRGATIFTDVVDSAVDDAILAFEQKENSVVDGQLVRKAHFDSASRKRSFTVTTRSSPIQFDLYLSHTSLNITLMAFVPDRSGSKFSSPTKIDEINLPFEIAKKEDVTSFIARVVKKVLAAP